MHDKDALKNQEVGGVVYRVSEQGVIMNFLEKVRRERVESQALAAVAAEARERGQTFLSAAAGATLPELAKEKEAEVIPGLSNAADSNAGADTALSNLDSAEREGVMGLLSMGAVPPPEDNNSSHLQQLVSQLVADVPEPVRNATSEVELLQSLQGLISQRLASLAPAKASSTN